MTEDRAGEQTRVAARSVLEELSRGGLDGRRREQVLELARTLSARSGTEGRLDRAAVVGTTGQLRELLTPGRRSHRAHRALLARGHRARALTRRQA